MDWRRRLRLALVVSRWPVAARKRGRRSLRPRGPQPAICSNPVAQRAVRLVAEGCRRRPARAGGTGAAARWSPRPAPASAETVAAQLLLHGNAYVQILKDGHGRPVELFALRPERVPWCPTRDGWPAAYLYRVGEKAVRIERPTSSGGPSGPSQGAPSGRRPLRRGLPRRRRRGGGDPQRRRRWNRALLDNAARPSGALVYEPASRARCSPPTSSTGSRPSWPSAFAGGGNAGRPMLLEGGLKWQALALTPADMDFVTLKAARRATSRWRSGCRRCCSGCPATATYANAARPAARCGGRRCCRWPARSWRGWPRGWRPGCRTLQLAVDLDRMPALAEDRERLWAQVGAAEFLSRDEKRALLGFGAGEANAMNQRRHAGAADGAGRGPRAASWSRCARWSRRRASRARRGRWRALGLDDRGAQRGHG